MNCSNRCNKKAKVEIPITKQKVCKVCWEENNYFSPVQALKVFAAIKLYGKIVYEVKRRYVFHSRVITTEHKLGIQTGPDDKVLTFEEIDWTLFKTLTLLPDVQRIKTKLIEKDFGFSTWWDPHYDEEGRRWGASVEKDFKHKVEFGSTEEGALFLAIFNRVSGKFE